MRAKTLRRNTKGKTDIATVAVLAIFAFVILSSASLPKIDIGNILNVGGGSSNLVDVNKKISVALTDEYAGSALASKSVKIYLGTTLKESLTTGADGTVNSAFQYPSGTAVSFLYVSSNTKQRFDVTVPQMTQEDAESATYNNIPLESFSVCTITDALRVGATSISDAGSYNFSATGDEPQFTYDMFVGSDNTGFKESHDPIYDMGWKAVVYMSLSGTNYETVLVYDFGDQFELGSTHWSASAIPATSITKYKVGNTYIHDGEGHFSFSLEGSGYSGNLTTMQLYLKIYSDPAYMKTHGANFGPDVVELAEHTVTLEA